MHIQNHQYKECKAKDNVKSTVAKGGFVKCVPGTDTVPGAIYKGGNTVSGKLYLDSKAEFDGKSTIGNGAVVVVGKNTKVRALSTFMGKVTFGATNVIGEQCTFLDGALTEDDVHIQNQSTIGGTIKSGGRVGHQATVLKGAIVDGGTLGDSAILGVDSIIRKGKTVEKGSCISTGLEITKNIDANMIMSRNGKLKKIATGKVVMYVNGDCKEMDKT